MGNTYVTNSRGTVYYLHSKDVSLFNNNGVHTIYFFSKVAEGAIPMPDGYTVVENNRSGLPFLKRIQQEQ